MVAIIATMAAGCVVTMPTPPVASPPSGTGDQNGSLGSCPVFPADNAWNADITTAPLHPNSAGFMGNLDDGFLHADFGGGGEYGIPYVTVPGHQPKLPIVFTEYGNESDPGPYPIPLGAPVEGGSDRHVLGVDRDACVLYELYHAFPETTRWRAGSGAVFDLRSNALRPDGWTSADAAGLPIFAGLARYDEVASGEVRHALRVTFGQTQRGYIHPATHFASSSTNPNRPPMGLRLRLRADFDMSGYSGQARVLLVAMQRYGLIVADNGSDWFVTGATDTRWDDEDLDQLKTVPGSAFEVVDTGPVITG